MKDIKLEKHIHGMAAVPSKNLEIIPWGHCARIILRNHEKLLHFALPTPTILGGQRLRAGKFYIRFSTSGSPTRIHSVKIMDGDKVIALVEGLSWSAGMPAQETFSFPAVEVDWGLGVILEVESKLDHAAIDIISVGVAFY